MDLNTIREVKRPASADDISGWCEGNAWLAGGTWLFSEPQLAIDTLIDLEPLSWTPLEASRTGLDVAATCRIAELERFVAPAGWTAAPLLRECAHALLMSFKIANEATVGGNICMSLPAGAMISLTVALEAVYTLWPRGGPAREIAATMPTCSLLGSCCVPSTSPLRHCRNASLSAVLHSPVSVARRRF
jgi:CO/xanthine dehydrogenase FAD-binding subunit